MIGGHRFITRHIAAAGFYLLFLRGPHLLLLFYCFLCLSLLLHTTRMASCRYHTRVTFFTGRDATTKTAHKVLYSNNPLFSPLFAHLMTEASWIHDTRLNHFQLRNISQGGGVPCPPHFVSLVVREEKCQTPAQNETPWGFLLGQHYVVTLPNEPMPRRVRHP